MEEIGKEEGKPLEEGLQNETHDLAQLEEPMPNSVDSVIVEMQKLIGDDGGVQLPADVSAPTVVETAEVAEVVTETDNDMQGDTGSDKIVGNVVAEDVRGESEMCLKVESDKVVGNVESEVPVKIEIDSVVSSVNPDSQRESEVCLENVSEENGEKGEEVKDVNVSQAVELGAAAESDSFVGNGDGEKGEELKDVNVIGATAEADNVVGNGDGGSHHTAQTTVEVEKEVNDGEEGKVLKDGASIKANPSNEGHMSVSQVEPDKCSGGDVAKEKLMDGVSSKAKPSTEPLASAETGKDVCKLEPDMPRDSKVAREKQVDVVIGKAKRSPNEQPSSGKANTVCKVERSIPQDNEVSMETEYESDDEDERRHALTGGLSSRTKFSQHHGIKEQLSKSKFHVGCEVGIKNLVPERTFLLDPGAEGDESGTEEEQAEFLKEVENLYREKHLEFKTPKFYKEELNLLKLWRAVIKLGGYEKVTSCKLWRQVGESFNPPKTCTTVSWTFRIFYEKALLEFEKQRWHGNELPLPEPSRVEIRGDGSQTCGSGRTLRDAAARAMQGWHSQRLSANGEEKPLSTMPKSDKLLKSSGLLKRKKLSPGDCAAQVADMKATRQRLGMTVFDIGPPAEWVKINVKRFSDCFEIYALVPGLLREELHVQSDPIGRLIISGQPMQPDNPWGVTPFKKVVSLPSRIDPHQTSAVVTLNGQLFVRVPFEQSDF